MTSKLDRYVLAKQSLERLKPETITLKNVSNTRSAKGRIAVFFDDNGDLVLSSGKGQQFRLHGEDLPVLTDYIREYTLDERGGL